MAGFNHCRRLDRHYEITLEAHEGFLYLSQIALLLGKLDRSQRGNCRPPDSGRRGTASGYPGHDGSTPSIDGYR